MVTADYSALIPRFAQYSKIALLYEVNAHPKPGLITPLSRGAHQDMDYALFQKSICAIADGFAQFPEEICLLLDKRQFHYAMPALQSFGRFVEERMFIATNGINTHKGAIFILLMLFAGCVINPDNLTAALMASTYLVPFLPHFLSPLFTQKRNTTGISALQQGIGGIRQEAAQGYPTIRHNYAFFVNDWQKQGANFALVANLIRNMAICDDTTLLNRQFDLTILQKVKQQAHALIPDNGQDKQLFFTQVTQLDRHFIENNLSPGGAADLTAATLFLTLWFQQVMCYEDDRK